MSQSLKALIVAPLLELNDALVLHFDEAPASDILGESLFALREKGTGRSLVLLALVADVLRTIETAVPDEPHERDPVVVFSADFLQMAARTFAKKGLSRYAEYGGGSAHDAARLLAFHRDDAGTFGGSNERTRWGGLAVCRNVARRLGDTGAIERYDRALSSLVEALLPLCAGSPGRIDRLERLRTFVASSCAEARRDPAAAGTDLDSERAALADEREALEAERTEMIRERTALADERNAIEAARAELASEREALDTQRADIDGLRTDLEAERAELADERSALAAGISELDAERTELAARAADLAAERERLHTERAALAGDFSRHETLQAKLDAERSELEEQRQALAADRRRVEQQAASRTAERAQFEEQRQTLDFERHALETERRQLRTEQEFLDSAHRELESAQERLNQTAAELDGRQTALVAESERLQSDFRQIENAREQLQTDSRRLDDDRARLRSEQQELESARAALEASRRPDATAAGDRVPIPRRDAVRPALLAAVMAGDVEQAAAALDAGADVNCAESSLDWQTPLLLAAGRGYAALVERLLERGANAEACDSAGRNALVLAVEGGFRDVVGCLLARGDGIVRQAHRRLTTLLRDRHASDQVRELVLMALATLGSRAHDAVPAIIGLLQSKSRGVGRAAAEALARVDQAAIVGQAIPVVSYVLEMPVAPGTQIDRGWVANLYAVRGDLRRLIGQDEAAAHDYEDARRIDPGIEVPEPALQA